jgi:UDP-N-acetylmuramoyl-tripeptide--D-alanyl-D-alanine ligase
MVESFYFQNDKNYPIMIIGKVGKTILMNLIQSIFNDNLSFPNTIHHFKDTRSLIEYKNKAMSSHNNFIFSLQVNRFHHMNDVFDIIEPRIVIITNIGDNHLSYNKSKSDYYSFIDKFFKKLPKDRLIILNKDDDLVAEIEERFPHHQFIRFGLNQNADFFAKNIQQLGPDGISFHMNDLYPINIQIFEFYQIYNVLASIALARCFNIPLDTVIKRIRENFNVPEGRGNLEKIGTVNIINDTKHNSYQSVITAAQTLVTFKNFANKSMMVIDRVDVDTKDSQQIHENLGHFLSALPLDVIITIGDEAKFIGKGIELIQNRKRTVIHTDHVEEAVMNLILFLEENDSIMLKSGKGSGLTKFIEILKSHMNQ